MDEEGDDLLRELGAPILRTDAGGDRALAGILGFHQLVELAGADEGDAVDGQRRQEDLVGLVGRDLGR